MQETQEMWVWSLGSGRFPWRRKWQLAPLFLPGESHGQWSLVGYSPWGHRESNVTEQPITHTHAHTRLTLCLTFWGTASSVFQSNCPIYVPTSTILRLLISPCLPQDLLLSVVFIISILVGVKWDISLWLPWLLMTSSIFSRASWQTACCKASPGYLNMWAEAWTPCLCWGKAAVFVGSVVGKSFLERRSSERSDWPWYLLKAWGPLGSPSGRGCKDKHW